MARGRRPRPPSSLLLHAHLRGGDAADPPEGARGRSDPFPKNGSAGSFRPRCVSWPTTATPSTRSPILRAQRKSNRGTTGNIGPSRRTWGSGRRPIRSSRRSGGGTSPTIDRYLALAASGEPLVEARETVEYEQQIIEAIYLGLRQNEGIRIADFEARFEFRFDRVFGEVLAELGKKGWMQDDAARCALTPEGHAVFWTASRRCSSRGTFPSPRRPEPAGAREARLYVSGQGPCSARPDKSGRG